MNTDIDNLTGTESLDELDAMLEQLASEDDRDTGQDTDTEKKDVVTAPSAVEVVADHEPQAGQINAGQGDEVATEPEKVILAKGGQHTIPYEVLEHTRHEAKVLREQNAQLQQAQLERNKLQALLEQHGINPEADPDQISLEEVEQLGEEYPDLGKTLTTLTRKIQQLERAGETPPVHPVINPVQAALQAVPDLMQWRDKDQDRFDFAITVDDKLKADPAWQGKSLDERFAEAARRTRVAFGDVLAPASSAATDKQAEQPADFIPASPSALGQTHHAPASGVARYGALTQTELVGEMGAMTDAQIDALLEQAGY